MVVGWVAFEFDDQGLRLRWDEGVVVLFCWGKLGGLKRGEGGFRGPGEGHLGFLFEYGLDNSIETETWFDVFKSRDRDIFDVTMRISQHTKKDEGR